jgi:regulator of protease activity HflC (stomatin/prohibitin superfamily)
MTRRSESVLSIHQPHVRGRERDAPLGSKSQLDRVVYKHVSAKFAPHGVDVHTVEIRDLILPGEMKDILNQIAQAEKVAQ